MLKEKRYHVTKHKSISVVKHIAEIIVVLNFKLRKPLFSTNYQKKTKPKKKNKKQKTRGTIQVPCLTHLHLKMENQTSISNTDKTKIQY